MSGSSLPSPARDAAAGPSINMLVDAEAQQAAAGPSNSGSGSRLNGNSAPPSHINFNEHGPHPPLPPPGTAVKRRGAGPGKRVSYYYDSDIGAFSYGYQHPMKPHRMRMTHNLVQAYGLDKHMAVHRPKRATPMELTRFHTDEYVDFLRMVTPETVAILTGDCAKHLPGAGEDCPAFEGLWDFCTISAGGSIGAAHQVSSGNSDISINWAGGLHHAKKREASGFCYVNDIVLCILELLRVHTRVLYIDIDVHHGDGVEEAFYSTDRVLTASFHKFGDFFPGTGDVKDIGMKGGKGYSINVPLKDGITEEAYMDIFKPVMSHIMDWYRPGAVVLQCGADSLAGDKLGCFNLSMRGHAACVEYMATYNVPLVILGGGGYTVRNVARTWTFETATVLGMDISPNLPYNAYMSYFGPDFKLDVPRNSMEDYNAKDYLEDIKAKIIDTLRTLPGAPSAPMQEVPRGPLFGVGKGRGGDELSNDEDSDLDVRITQRIRDAHVGRYGDELSDGGENDGEEEDDDAFFGIGPNPPNRPRLIPRGYEDDSEDEVMYDGRLQDRSFAGPSGSSMHSHAHGDAAHAGTNGNRAGSRSSSGKRRAAATAVETQRAQSLLPPVWRGGGSGPPSSSLLLSQSHPHAWNADPDAIVRAFPYHNPYSRHRPKRSFFSSHSRPSANLADLRAAMTQQGFGSGAGAFLHHGAGRSSSAYGNGLLGGADDEDAADDEGGYAHHLHDERRMRGYHHSLGFGRRRYSRDAPLHRPGSSSGLPPPAPADGHGGDAGTSSGLSGAGLGSASASKGGARNRDKERERKAAREREWERAKEWRVSVPN